MKYLWTTLHVKNMEESLKFYREIIGLKLNSISKISPEFELAFLGSGDTQVELIFDKSKEIKYENTDISMGFQAESLDLLIEQLKQKGISVFAGPIQPNPNVRFFYILDPNGIKIQFVEFLK
ncbi:MAG: VOC family protein [Bacteroidales bacterium]|nr:VOC family protein [Bacteroidales bacterium]MDY0215686.1 VOC family protein [Bacteroidales bacterium]